MGSNGWIFLLFPFPLWPQVHEVIKHVPKLQVQEVVRHVPKAGGVLVLETIRFRWSSRYTLENLWNTADVPDSKWVTFEWRHQPLNFQGVWSKFQVWEQWMIHTLAGWWLNQPIWKICSSKWVHLPHFSGWNRKYVRNHHPAKIRHGVWNFDWISVKKPGRGTNSRADRWGSSHPNHRKGGWGEANVQNEGLIHWLSKLTDKSHSNLQID